MKTGYDQFFKKAKETGLTQRRVEALQTLRKHSAHKKTKKPFPIMPFVAFAFLGLGSYFALDHLDDLENKFKKIEITMGMAEAEEAHAPTAAAAPAADAKSEAKADGERAAGKDGKIVEKKSADDADYLFKLAERKKVLDQREEDLNKLSAELEKQKVEIEKKMKELEETRTKISAVLQEKIKADDAKVESLVQMYTNMKPQQVAKVFETLDEDLVIDILSRMKKKTAADILNLIKPEKAQIFAERFTGYRAPANSN